MTGGIPDQRDVPRLQAFHWICNLVEPWLPLFCLPVCGFLYCAFCHFIVFFFVVSRIIVNFAARNNIYYQYYDSNSKKTSDDPYGTIFQFATGDEP
jgi:hypothetical protein